MSSRESNNCVGPKAVFNVVARIELQIVLSPMFVGQIHGDLSGWDVKWLRRSRPIYAALEPLNVNVVGNRVTGVDVGCFHLRGGGYSCKTTQHGLTIDTVAYELVKPNGDVVTATKASDSELFFGLKGGFNNFVRNCRQVHAPDIPPNPSLVLLVGGLITITAPFIPDVAAATAAFAATLADLFRYYPLKSRDFELLFYAGPGPPAGIFDAILAIPYFTEDVSTRSHLSLVQSSPANATAGLR
ncbi:hypothetical protein BDZ97DRAFT_1922007 [Flammula alnicola]|nr:hypothetical protein BDZ97DRAFT_1922007 [Flammula alnicola]